MLKKKLLNELYYSKKLSMVDVAGSLLVTPATVKYWMQKYDFNRRSSSESAYVKQNPNGDPFKIKDKLTQKDRELLLCGLMLYWAEGSRKNQHVVQLANLDIRMVKFFMEFLRNICGVIEDKLCITVQLYRKFDKETTKSYWSRALGIPDRNIFVTIHSDGRSKPNQQWSRFGIARIEVRNVKLKRWIDGALEKYLNKVV